MMAGPSLSGAARRMASRVPQVDAALERAPARCTRRRRLPPYHRRGRGHGGRNAGERASRRRPSRHRGGGARRRLGLRHVGPASRPGCGEAESVAQERPSARQEPAECPIPAGEPLPGARSRSPSITSTRDVVLAAGRVGGFDQLRTAPLRVARVPLHGVADARPRAPGRSDRRCTAAGRYRARRECAAISMKSGSSGACSSEPTSRKTSLRRGMAHGLGFGQFAGVFALADRRVVVRDLADLRRARIWYRRESPTCPITAEPFSSTATVSTQAMPSHSGLARACAEDFVIGHGDGFADALLGGAGLALQAGAHALHRDLGGLLAGRLPANAVHHQEDAAVGVDVAGVFVVPAHAAGVARPRALQIRLNHSTRFGNPRKRTPARPIRACAGTGASRLRSRFSPSTNSMLDGAVLAVDGGAEAAQVLQEEACRWPDRGAGGNARGRRRAASPA